MFYRNHIKRPMDLILSLIAIIVLSPVLIVVALLVKFKLGSPVIFKQPRPGLNEKIFMLYKFRTMTNKKDENGDLLPDSMRITKFGKFLRTTSLDELPELFNIIKGDMALVGPRPLSIHYLPYYSSKEKIRHTARPGLTGLAQINGRNDLQWEERFSLDIKYISDLKLMNDLKITLSTVVKVLKRSNVTIRGSKDRNDFNVYRVLQEEGLKMKKNIKEIGSYFWLDGTETKSNDLSPVEWLPHAGDSVYTLSGRAAIDYAINDIMRTREIKNVYMPAYCCVSMVQPFLDKNITIEFYDVEYDGEIRYLADTNKKCSIFFAMSYFGLGTTLIDDIITVFRKQGIPVIEDITHRLLCYDSYAPNTNYCVASLRKWFPIPSGGYLLKREGELTSIPDRSGDEAVQQKIEAMHMKYDYLVNGIGEKEFYLKENANFENALIRFDRRLQIDSLSAGILKDMDIDFVIKQRQKNAKILYDGLKEISAIQYLIPTPNWEKDVPLFVPILLESEKRDNLRQYLIEHGVYCPIHWPEVMGTKPGIRANELSLICDQRYDENDMIYIIELIKAWNNSLQN